MRVYLLLLQVQALAELSCEKSISNLDMMLPQCCMLEATDSMRAAHEVLNAHSATPDMCHGVRHWREHIVLLLLRVRLKVALVTMG